MDQMKAGTIAIENVQDIDSQRLFESILSRPDGAAFLIKAVVALHGHRTIFYPWYYRLSNCGRFVIYIRKLFAIDSVVNASIRVESALSCYTCPKCLGGINDPGGMRVLQPGFNYCPACGSRGVERIGGWFYTLEPLKTREGPFASQEEAQKTAEAQAREVYGADTIFLEGSMTELCLPEERP